MGTLFEQPLETDMATAELAPQTDPTPLMILQQAVDRGLDADQLGKLMDLQERWERNQAEKEYSAAMHACQQAMPKVVRDAKNPQTKSMYARMESVQEVARPVYSAHGFSLSYGESDCPVASFKRTVCDVRHVGGACVRYHLDLPIDGIGPQGNPIGGMNKVQGCISTTSYGQRRLLCMIFNITIAGEDDDGEGGAAISGKQIESLNTLLLDTDADLDKFLEFFGIESLDKLPAKRFDEAMKMLNRKRRNANR